MKRKRFSEERIAFASRRADIARSVATSADGTERTLRDVRLESVMRTEADIDKQPMSLLQNESGAAGRRPSLIHSLKLTCSAAISVSMTPTDFFLDGTADTRLVPNVFRSLTEY